MAEAYCVKCKEKREMVDAKEEKTSNGRRLLKGICPTCGTKMNKFLPNK
jgi:ssDNA-binding Zn-finger/Zn-ribbon topoisomerase 1